MGSNRSRLALAFLFLLVLAWPAAAAAEALPSKPEPTEDSARESDLTRVQSALARQEVAQALAAHGLRPEEVAGRLAELSPEDLRSLAANVEQVQAAGSVPNYIWVLLGIFLAVSILAAVL
jgi:hypothetical protein